MALAMKRIARVMDSLDAGDRAAVAFYVWRHYGGDVKPKSQSPGARRMALHRDGDLRSMIRERDGDTCRYCGAGVNWTDRRGPYGATYDHIDPAGENSPENIVVACRGCNAAKGDRTPEQAGMILRSTPDLDPELNPDLLPAAENLPRVCSSSLGSNGSSQETTASNRRASLRRDAVEVLKFLNEKTGKSFREVDGNLLLIMARLASGATVQDCRGVVARQARAWKDDEKMMRYLRPETLFNRTKFESYLGQREAGAP